MTENIGILLTVHSRKKARAISNYGQMAIFPVEGAIAFLGEVALN